MDFGIYPPEVNSGRMYAGPGSGPMLAAAQAWDNVADELYATVAGYQSVVSEMAWSGPSAAAMRAAAASFVAWLLATAEQAERTAAQAWAATAAYEAAFAATVPPPEVAANRGLLAMLLATNLFGQNTPGIAATEALYAEMWAQDAVAMYASAGSSAAAVALTPFTPPRPNTRPAEAGAVAADALTSLVTLAVYVVIVSDLVTLYGIVPADLITAFGDFPPSAFTTASGVLDDETFSSWNGIQPWPRTGPAAVEPFWAPLARPPTGGVPAPAMSAAIGEAETIGALTVPASWVEVDTAAAEFSTANTVNPMGIGAVSGQPTAIAKAPETARPTGDRDDAELEPAPRIIVTDIAAAIRDIAGQLVAGQLNEQEFTERKERLLDISFAQ